jgi:hypothetical protein
MVACSRLADRLQPEVSLIPPENLRSAIFALRRSSLIALKRLFPDLAQWPIFWLACEPTDVVRRLFDLTSFHQGMTMRRCRQAFAAAMICFAAPAAAEPVYDIDLYALMSGKCSTLRVAGRDFACKAVAYFHSQQGRADFTIVLDDPADKSHIISFSGENARREQENLYELSIDRMLLRSKDRPKVDGLAVPFVELSTGTCSQLGNFATGQLSSVSCSAIDANGKKYELQFESDGSPMTVRRLRQYPLPTEARRAKQIAQLKCRLKVGAANILPRDQTAYIIRCLAEDGDVPAATGRP